MKRLRGFRAYWLVLFLGVPTLAIQAVWVHPGTAGLTASDDSKGGFGG